MPATGSVEGFEELKGTGVLGSSGSSGGPLWELSMVPARELESGMLLKKAVEKSLSPRRESQPRPRAPRQDLHILNTPVSGPETRHFQGGFHAGDREVKKKVKPFPTLHSVGPKTNWDFMRH